MINASTPFTISFGKKYVVESFLDMRSSILTFARARLVLNIVFFFLFSLS